MFVPAGLAGGEVPHDVVRLAGEVVEGRLHVEGHRVGDGDDHGDSPESREKNQI